MADRDRRPADRSAARRHPLAPGSCTLPLPGIGARIVDETGRETPDGQGGSLVFTRPWPAMLRTLWGDDARFLQTYFPAELGGKTYLAGDGALRDPATGYYTITGRIDDVLSVSGHRLGTMAVESALVAHPEVAEAAVVGRHDALTGEAIVAFVVPKGGPPDDAPPRGSPPSCAPGSRARSDPSPSPGDPLRRQPAQDALRQDHAPPAARDRQRRSDHAGHFHAGESGGDRAAQEGGIEARQ